MRLDKSFSKDSGEGNLMTLHQHLGPPGNKEDPRGPCARTVHSLTGTAHTPGCSAGLQHLSYGTGKSRTKPLRQHGQLLRLTAPPPSSHREVVPFVKLHISVIKVLWYPNPFSLQVFIWSSTVTPRWQSKTFAS